MTTADASPVKIRKQFPADCSYNFFIRLCLELFCYVCASFFGVLYFLFSPLTRSIYFCSARCGHRTCISLSEINNQYERNPEVLGAYQGEKNERAVQFRSNKYNNGLTSAPTIFFIVMLLAVVTKYQTRIQFSNYVIEPRSTSNTFHWMPSTGEIRKVESSAHGPI